MKISFYNFCIAFLSLSCLLCGCGYKNGVFMEVTLPQQISSYKPPVKFYVQDIIIDPGSDAKNFFTTDQAQGWKNNLLRYYPDVFVSDQNDALPVTFLLYNQGNIVDKHPGLTLFTGILSFLGSYGVFPAIKNYTSDVKIVTNIAGKTRAYHTKLDCRLAVNMGWGGFILPTCYLVPQKKGAMFGAKAAWFDEPFRVYEDNMKNFLSIFVSELQNFSQNQIIELYLSQKTKKAKLLE